MSIHQLRQQVQLHIWNRAWLQYHQRKIHAVAFAAIEAGDKISSNMAEKMHEISGSPIKAIRSFFRYKMDVNARRAYFRRRRLRIVGPAPAAARW